MCSLKTPARETAVLTGRAVPQGMGREGPGGGGCHVVVRAGPCSPIPEGTASWDRLPHSPGRTRRLLVGPLLGSDLDPRSCRCAVAPSSCVVLSSSIWLLMDWRLGLGCRGDLPWSERRFSLRKSIVSVPGHRIGAPFAFQMLESEGGPLRGSFCEWVLGNRCESQPGFAVGRCKIYGRIRSQPL